MDMNNNGDGPTNVIPLPCCPHPPLSRGPAIVGLPQGHTRKARKAPPVVVVQDSADAGAALLNGLATGLGFGLGLLVVAGFTFLAVQAHQAEQ